MPENMTEERKQIIKNFGGELIECAANDFLGAVAIRDKLAQENGYFNPDQFSNPLNVECHRHTTGQEILRQIKPYAQKIDALVAGVGTGGTLIGIGKALKEKYPNIHIVAVEPSESAVMSGGKPGAHRIGGIGDGFIPSIAQGDNGNIHEIIHEVVCISSDEARQASRELKQKHGYCVGMSSGANFLAAKKLHERFTTVVTVFPDGYYKYQSLGLEASKRHHCQCKKSQSLIC